MTEFGEHLDPPEIGPPPAEFFDDKTTVLFCMDQDLQVMARNLNRANRSIVMNQVGLVDPVHVDEYSPELWDLPPHEFWSQLTTEYADGGFDITDLQYAEADERWRNSSYEPQSIRQYVTLWNAIAQEGLETQLIGSVDPVAAKHLIESIEGDFHAADHVSRNIMPNTVLPDEAGGHDYSGKNNSDISLAAVQKYKMLVPKRTAIITDSPAIVEEAKARGYSVIGVGQQFRQPLKGVQPDFVAAQPWEIQVNPLMQKLEDYVAPEKPDLLAADGTTEFWVKAFWDQVAHDSKEPHGWSEESILRLGFDDAIVRKTVITAVATKSVTGEHADKLPPLALTLVAYDGTPYKSNYESLCAHNTLIRKFDRLYGTFDRAGKHQPTTGTHLYEDAAGRVLLYVGSENELHNMASPGDERILFKDGAPDELLEVMRAYGIDYIITGNRHGKGYITDRDGNSREVQTLTDEERQKKLIDQMVVKAALDNGFSERTHPELWQIYHAELWRHWDNNEPINVYEYAASMAELA